MRKDVIEGDTLIIRNVNRNDDGRYICRVPNVLDNDITRVTVVGEFFNLAVHVVDLHLIYYPPFELISLTYSSIDFFYMLSRFCLICVVQLIANNFNN